MTKRVRKREPKTATSNMGYWPCGRGTVRNRREREREGAVAQAPPVPGTGNAPVARRVISPYTSGSVTYSPSTHVLRLPW